MLFICLIACNKKSSKESLGNSTLPLSTSSTTTSNSSSGSQLPVGSIPTKFTQKALLEVFDSDCAAGIWHMRSLMNANPNKVYGACLVGNPTFEIPFSQASLNYFISGAGLTSIYKPNGVVSRTPSIETGYANSVLNLVPTWKTALDQVLARSAPCGLSMVSQEADDKIKLDVYIGYNKPFIAVKGKLKLTVYLIETDLLCNGFLYHDVIRHVATANFGDDIHTVSSDKYTKVSFNNIDISGKYEVKSNLRIIAFVNQDANLAKDLDILNVQQVNLNEIKKWD